MKNAIYISNGQIQALSYQRKKGEAGATVSSFLQEPIPERSVFNGVVLDAAALSASLENLAEGRGDLFKTATLVLDSSAILTKKIPTPKLTRDQALTVVREEIGSNATTYEGLIFDAGVYTEGEGVYLLGAAMEQSVVEDYRALFQSAGITLEDISVGLDLVIQYVEKRPELCRGSVAICLVDQVSLLSTIFTDGVYMFSTRTRLVGDEPEALVEELLGSLTGIVQFNKQISRAFYLGLEPETLALLSARKHYNIEAEILPLNPGADLTGGEDLPSSSHFAVLAALRGEKSMNFVRAAKRGSAAPKPKLSRLQAVLGAAALAVLLLYGLLFFQTYRNNLEIGRLTDYLQDPENLAAQERSDQLEGWMESLFTVQTQLEAAQQAVTYYPAIDQAMIDWLFGRAANVSIQRIDFDAAGPTLRLTYNSATELDSSNYVEMIRSYEDFASVVYTGYSAQADWGYTFEISITLKETAPAPQAASEDEEAAP